MLLGVVALVLTLVTPVTLGADDPVSVARSLLGAWHEDPGRIDRARTLLEAAGKTGAGPDALVELARVWFLVGDFRSDGDGERAAAYQRGIEAARRAIACGWRSTAGGWRRSEVSCERCHW
jgi:hypothetical protein